MHIPPVTHTGELSAVRCLLYSLACVHACVCVLQAVLDRCLLCFMVRAYACACARAAGRAVPLPAVPHMEFDPAPVCVLQAVLDLCLLCVIWHVTLLVRVRVHACVLQAVLDRDPACSKYSQCLLYFKGFQAVQCYRVTHWLWQRGRKVGVRVRAVWCCTRAPDVRAQACWCLRVCACQNKPALVSARVRAVCWCLCLQLLGLACRYFSAHTSTTSAHLPERASRDE